MGWVNDALTELQLGRPVDVRPQGDSMRGLIESGQRVTIAPVDVTDLQIDDIVLIEWKGNHLLHLIKDLSLTEVQIGNNLGKINGWALRSAIRGKVILIHPKQCHPGSIQNPNPQTETTSYQC